jgi:hypothetical protein
MDNETLSLFKTVCAAGAARPVFDDGVNERLDQLAGAGLLEVVPAGEVGPKRSALRAYYRPTKTGRALCRTLGEKGAA